MARLLAIAGVFLCMAAGAAAMAGGAPAGPSYNRPTTFAELEPLAHQWNISLQVSTPADNGAFVPRVCDSPDIDAACNQPLLTADTGDHVRVVATLNGTALKTLNDEAAANVTLKLCFSKPFVADRPWRKPADVVDNDKSCPLVLGKFPIHENNTYEATMALPKGAATATYYVQVLVECKNATSDVPSICQLDATKGKAFFAVHSINSVPTSLVAAAAVCSCVAPAVLILFFIKERGLKKKQ